MDKMHLANWLETARAFAGITQTELARRTGIEQEKLSNVKKGKRKLQVPEVALVSKATGYPAPRDENSLDVLGYVGAGAEVFPIDDGDPLHQVTIDFPLPYGSVGAIIRGDSMFPIFEDGDLVAYAGETIEPSSAVGLTCVVQVADGRMLIKTIRRGSDDGLFTLTSANAADITDVELDWAREFIMRISRKFWRRSAKW